jgi:hypothetical protein
VWGVAVAGAATSCAAAMFAGCDPGVSSEPGLPAMTTMSDASSGGSSGSSGGSSGSPGAYGGSDGSTGDVISGSSSGDDAATGSPFDATSEGGPPSSSDAGPPVDVAGPPGCPNPLGSVWSVTESDNACASTWKRQGSTSTFTDTQAAPCNVTATVTLTLSGTDVAAYWTSSSDNDDCNYLGTMNADCSSVSGVYTCAGGDAASGTWQATIQ